ncbi:hypothetical protein B0H14DRAFT_2821083 [Mycena olivaceomarginata]|nr:hypothetical protein B0H14DRAFT_2821083 [Mycena olivaceomarginata]
MAFSNSGPSMHTGAISNDADTALALGSVSFADPTHGSPLSQFSDLSFDDEALMDLSDAELATPSPAALKRKLPSLLSSSSEESNSALGGRAPNKKARRSRTTYAGATGAGASPPTSGSPTRQDGFVTDTEMESFLESILNELAEENQQRGARQERYASDSLDGVSIDFSAPNSAPSSPNTTTNLFLSSYDNASDDESSENLLNRFQSLNLDAEYRSRAQLDLDADYTERPHDIPDESQAEMLSDLFLRDLSLSILDHDQTRTEALSISPGFSPHDERESDKAQMAVEPDTVWWGPPDADGEEMDLDAHPFDGGGSEDESSESALDTGRSRCPCNLCSPKAPTNPDYHPSRQSQQEIHRLFSQSPFAHPTHSTL